MTFLARVQQEDGSWVDEELPTEQATALAMLAFIGAGIYHNYPAPWKDHVKDAARSIRKWQREDGCIAATPDGDDVTSHAMATLALAELYGATMSPLFRARAVRAADHLVERTRDTGLWAESLDGAGEVDVTASAWAVLALHARTLAFGDVGVPWEELWSQAEEYAGRTQTEAADLLLLLTSGAARDAGCASAGFEPDPLRAARLQDDRTSLDWIYSALVALAMDGDESRWFEIEGRRLSAIAAQIPDSGPSASGDIAKFAGSWNPGRRGFGRVGTTALRALLLELPARYGGAND